MGYFTTVVNTLATKSAVRGKIDGVSVNIKGLDSLNAVDVLTADAVACNRDAQTDINGLTSPKWRGTLTGLNLACAALCHAPQESLIPFVRSIPALAALLAAARDDKSSNPEGNVCAETLALIGHLLPGAPVPTAVVRKSRKKTDAAPVADPAPVDDAATDAA
jgi:hypothetical protein